ncbi:serine hydrolase domain-containing protein [Paraflavitalea sp. CAU 1676]|uniref:serine hydrolase domain-containing protein n=1 Tax=Paraflavitalea sp. CAU 1676 TaxID=3032598 RepID=UPI0023DA4B5C|nr:serine hydrolase domain-containing protein [Paraflavitalea sp. CAU 1676]MDF2193015.1 serine hydrolase [Paraflavitalea sp. CAU 1676]
MKSLAILLLTLATATTGSAPVTEPVPMLNGRKTTSTEELTKKIKAIADAQKLTGLSMVVVKNNVIIYRNYFGVKNQQTGEPFTDNTVSYAASLTKPLFTYLFLKLVDKGVFELDKPVYTYLKQPIGEYPKWKDLEKQPEFNKVTARMLLSHSSGLPVLRYFYGDSTTLTLINKPGKAMYYSNEGMNLLGFIVEEHTGKGLQALCSEYIYEPLGMKHTAMVWQKEFEADYAVGHDKDGKVIGAEKRTSARGAGSMVTTAGDYGLFVADVLGKKGLSSALYAQMLSPQIRVTSKRGFGPLRDSLTDKSEFRSIDLSWGLGWGLIKTPHGKAFFHGGHSEGWQNYCVSYPEKGISVILLSNSDNFEGAAGKILETTIGDTWSPLKWLSYYDH